MDELVGRARLGDEDAFAVLVERHHAAVHRVVRLRLGNEHDAQDAVQETFVRAWRELPGLRDPARFPGWLRRIAERRCHDARRRWRQDTLPIEGFEWAEPAADRAAAVTAAAVRAAVARLPRATGQAARLFYLEGYSVAEVAALLRVPSGTVKRRLHDARNQLRTALAGVAGTRRAGGDMPTFAFDVRAEALRVALGRVLVALPTENRSAHHCLDAVLFDLGRDRLTLAAADGYRVAEAVVDVASAGGRRLLLPGRALAALARSLERASERDRVRVTLPGDGGETVFSTALATVSCRPVEGTFPDLDAVMPSVWRTRLGVDGPDLRRVVAALEEIAPDARPLMLEAATGELTLRLELSEDAVVRSALPAAVEGEPGRLWLDARLLRSLLDVSAGARVELSWSATAAPLVIRDVEGRGRWGVMPLRAPAEERTAA